MKEENIELSYNAWKKSDSEKQINEDKTMSAHENKINEYINLLQTNHNLIFHGAPGTGKTFTAKEMASQMIFGEIINEDEMNDVQKEQWQEQFGFVQFHPSYDYTDFVEGLRPSKNEIGQIVSGFERVDGVFKEFCERAAKSISQSTTIDNFEESWNLLVEKLNEEDYIEVPLLSSSSKTIKIELNEYGTGLANRTYENDVYEKDKWIQGRSKFFNKEQLYNIYKGLPGVPAGGHDNYRKAIVKYMKDNFKLRDYYKEENQQNEKNALPFIFLIDEINRGESSKIFGELFFSIDPGYRGIAGKINTQYQNLVPEGDIFKDGFYVPENVYIIGTMNDIDRSVETMEFAFRRRFAWKNVKASDTQDMLDSLEKDGISKDVIAESKAKMDAINQKIVATPDLGESYQIGAAYFMKLKEYKGDFEKLWKYHLEGLITEYLRGQGDLEKMVGEFKQVYDGNKNNNAEPFEE